MISSSRSIGLSRPASVFFGLLILAAFTGSPSFGAPAPAAATPPFPGYLNQYFRASDPSLKAWDIGINVRLRDDDREGAGTTDAGSNWDFSQRPVDDNNNQFLISRVMPRVGYTGKSVSFLVETRSSYSLGDERFSAAAAGQNLPDRDGPLDVYQAFVLIGDLKQFPVTLKIGRQELVYGEQRILGHARWLNVPRTFDALKLHYENPAVGLDVFTGGVVYADHGNFNHANSQDILSGIYANFPQVSKNDVVESYLLARNVARGIVTDDWSGVAAPARFPAPQDIYTFGLRVKSKAGTHGPWDYGIEVMYQFGNRTAVFPATTVAAALAAPRLDQSAYALIAQASYAWPKASWSPRLTAILSIASGDDNPADGKSGTFQNLFPSNHLLYGAMDLSGLQNFRDLRFSYAVKPRPNLTLTLETNFQYLDSTSDFWYNAAGAPRNFAGAAVGSGGGYRINPSYHRTLGQEVDLIGAWTFTPSAQLEAGVGRYFRGDYIKQSLSSVGSKDAGYLYLQLTLSL